jgi:hypothetical protein
VRLCSSTVERMHNAQRVAGAPGLHHIITHRWMTGAGTGSRGWWGRGRIGPQGHPRPGPPGWCSGRLDWPQCNEAAE